MNEALNNWVIQKLNASNMSIRQLAVETKLDPSNISKILSGKRNAGLDFYVKIARYFNAVPEMLEAAGILTEETEGFFRLKEIYQRLSPTGKAWLEEFAALLLEREQRSK